MYGERTIRRFVSKIEVRDFDDCWEWLHAKNSAGYGEFGYNRKLYRANRFSYMLVCGELYDTEVVMHTCDNKKCCNPRHLKRGTYKENTIDSISKGIRNDVGESNPNSKLTWKEVNEIREFQKTGRFSQFQLAKMFGVSQSTIGFIVRNEHWYDENYQKWLNGRDESKEVMK